MITPSHCRLNHWSVTAHCSCGRSAALDLLALETFNNEPLETLRPKLACEKCKRKGQAKLIVSRMNIGKRERVAEFP